MSLKNIDLLYFRADGLKRGLLLALVCIMADG